MAQVNKYPTRAEYAADGKRSPDKSAVSYVEQNGELIYVGVNVVVGPESADIGDLAVFDKADNAVRFVKGATLVPTRMPAELVPVAVVYAVRGEKVHVVSLDNATYNGSTSIRWAASYEVALSGFDLAAGGSFTLRINATDYPFSYAAGATLADIAGQINANATIKSTYGWMASVDGARIVLSSNATTPAYAAINAVGCEIRRTPEDRSYPSILTGVLIDGGVDYVRRKNYVTTSWAGCNAEKFLQFRAVNGDVKTGQKPGSIYVLRESVFTEADNPDLVAAYPSYRDYLLSENMLQYPTACGAFLRDGKANTSKIGRLRFVDIYGETAPCYPAAAAALEYGVTGLEAGAWWLPSVEEAYLLMCDRALTAADRESDPVNRTLGLLGVAACYGAGCQLWTSCEYALGTAYIYYGPTGNVSASAKSGMLSVRLVSIIPINL